MLSENLKRLWKDKNYRRKQSLAHKRAWKRSSIRRRMLKGKRSPEARRKSSEATKRSWANAVGRKRRLIAVHSDSYKRKMRASTLASWRDQKVRDRRLAGQRKHSRSRSYRKEQSERMQVICNKPSYKRKMSQSLKNRWKSKEARKKQSKVMKEKFKDPVFATKWGRERSKHPNKPEKAMIKILKRLKLAFAFQFGLVGYIPDFVLVGKKVVLEVDGRYWHELPVVVKRDDAKRRAFTKAGYAVLRFWERDVLKDPEKVIRKIMKKVRLAAR